MGVDEANIGLEKDRSLDLFGDSDKRIYGWFPFYLVQVAIDSINETFYVVKDDIV